MKYQDLINELKDLGNEEYLNFTKKLSNSNKIIIGVNLPTLKTYAKKIDIDEYLKYYQGIYFEEIMIYGLSLGYLKEKEDLATYMFSYSKEIDNWSLCDSPASNMKLIKKHNDYFIKNIEILLNDKDEFVIRFGLVLLLFHYVNEKYIDYILNVCVTFKSDKYYINMAISWLLCECFIKFQSKADKYINKEYLDKFVLNKTISKICDSYRVDKGVKIDLKKRRI